MKAFHQRFQSKTFFTYRDAALFLSQYGISHPYLKLFIHQLTQKGKIKRIGKGKYTFLDDASVVGFGFEPFYYGLQHALTLHHLWNQATIPVIVTTRKVRTGTRMIIGQKTIIRRIRPSLFFGFEMIRESNHWLPVSTIEKTLIDMVHFRQKIIPDLVEAFEKRIDEKKLHELLKKTSLRTRKRIEKIRKK